MKEIHSHEGSSVVLMWPVAADGLGLCGLACRWITPRTMEQRAVLSSARQARILDMAQTAHQ